MIDFKDVFGKIDHDKYKFWEFVGKQKVKINLTKLVFLFNQLGFINLEINKSVKGKILVYVGDNNFVEEPDEKPQNFLFNKFFEFFPKLRELYPDDNFELIEEELRDKIDKYFNIKQLSAPSKAFNIPTKFMRANKETAFFYFHSSCVKVTKDKVDVIHYVSKEWKDLRTLVWKDKVVKDKIFSIEDDFYNCQFYQFLQLISYGEKEEYVTLTPEEEFAFDNLKQTIGYLLHHFKDRSEPKLAIFTDLSSGTENKGGRGKGIIFQAIQQILPTTVIKEGDKFDTSDPFCFSLISLTTDLFLIDDAKANIQLKPLYTVLSDGMEITRKYKNTVWIGYEDSPKFALTTNTNVNGESDSDERRKHYVELFPFFNATKKPIHYFKNMFFSSDWSRKEWDGFFNTLVHCVQLYLQKGLLEYSSEALIEKRLIAELHGETNVKFFENLERNKYFTMDELIVMYKESDGDEKNAIASNLGRLGEKYAKIVKIVAWRHKERYVGNKRAYGLITQNQDKGVFENVSAQEKWCA